MWDAQPQALPSDGTVSRDACCNFIHIFCLFYLPSLHTNLDGALGPPCPCSVSKEKEQFVFVLFLLKGKPSLAKRNLNQIAGLETQCKSTELSLGRERQLAAEVGEHFEDKHCGFRAVWEAYLICWCLQDNWTLAANSQGQRGAGVPGPTEIQCRTPVCKHFASVLRSRASLLDLARFSADRALSVESLSATAKFKPGCRVWSWSFGLAQSLAGLFLLTELSHPCNFRSQYCLLWVLIPFVFMLSVPNSCLLVPLDLWFMDKERQTAGGLLQFCFFLAGT